MVRPRMPLIAVRANSEEGVFEAKAERNNSTLIIKWAPFIWARWGAPSICPSSPETLESDNLLALYEGRLAEQFVGQQQLQIDV